MKPNHTITQLKKKIEELESMDTEEEILKTHEEYEILKAKLTILEEVVGEIDKRIKKLIKLCKKGVPENQLQNESFIQGQVYELEELLNSLQGK